MQAQIKCTLAINYFTFSRKDILNLDKLEAQLKACLCRIVFSKAKVRTTSKQIDTEVICIEV